MKIDNFRGELYIRYIGFKKSTGCVPGSAKRRRGPDENEDPIQEVSRDRTGGSSGSGRRAPPPRPGHGGEAQGLGRTIPQVDAPRPEVPAANARQRFKWDLESVLLLLDGMEKYGSTRPPPVVMFWPKYRSTHPENYLFSLSKKMFSGSKYPKKQFI